MAEGEKIKLEIEIPASELEVTNLEVAKAKGKLKPKPKNPEPTLASYKPADILTAPIEKPEPEDKRPPNIHQKRVIMIGLWIVLASLIVWAFAGLAAGVVLALAGALMIATGTLVRI